jgi:hypothetical protein
MRPLFQANKHHPSHPYYPAIKITTTDSFWISCTFTEEGNLDKIS